MNSAQLLEPFPNSIRGSMDPAEVVDLWAMCFKRLTRALDNSLLWRRRCNASECIHLDTFRRCRWSKHVGVCWKNSWLELIIWDNFTEIDQILIRGLRSIFVIFARSWSTLRMMQTWSSKKLWRMKLRYALDSNIPVPQAEIQFADWLCDFIVVECTWIHWKENPYIYYILFLLVYILRAFLCYHPPSWVNHLTWLDKNAGCQGAKEWIVETEASLDTCESRKTQALWPIWAMTTLLLSCDGGCLWWMLLLEIGKQHNCIMLYMYDHIFTNCDMFLSKHM